MKNNRIINKEVLDLHKAGSYIAMGIFTDEGSTNMAGTGNELRWVAVRGYVPDWAIYCENPYDGGLCRGLKRISEVGSKVPKSMIK